ncbi:MAG: hypothetical protein KDI75_11520 [Xanthomonadales bacterium]|nr:hypothetical protein [Xanthomonadales bacterium]
MTQRAKYLFAVATTITVMAVVVAALYFHEDVRLGPGASAGATRAELEPGATENKLTGADELSKSQTASALSDETAEQVVHHVKHVDPAALDRVRSSRLVEDWDQIVEDAQSDPSLAYALSDALLKCSISGGFYSRLSDSLDKKEISPDKAESQLGQIESLRNPCVGLDDAHTELRFDLAAMAARAGILEAQMNYKALAADFVSSREVLRRPEAVREYVDNVRRFTVEAAATGDPNALFNAYDLFSNGIFTEPDVGRAYHYLRQYNDAMQSDMSRLALEAFLNGLTPEERRAVEASGG